MHHAFDAGAFLGGEAFVVDLGIDQSGLLQPDALGANGAARGAADDDVIGFDAAFDERAGIDNEQLAADVAVHRSLDQDVAVAFQVALHFQPFVDDREGLLAVPGHDGSSRRGTDRCGWRRICLRLGPGGRIEARCIGFPGAEHSAIPRRIELRVRFSARWRP